jgi:hypothetical protein
VVGSPVLLVTDALRVSVTGGKGERRGGLARRRPAGKYRNRPGRERTREDGDLRRYTRVDGLPLDGMQEVWGSNPHISTGQKRNSKARIASTAEKYCHSAPLRRRACVRIGHVPRLELAGRVVGLWLLAGGRQTCELRK